MINHFDYFQRWCCRPGVDAAARLLRDEEE
jgi:hypothetical protein